MAKGKAQDRRATLGHGEAGQGSVAQGQGGARRGGGIAIPCGAAAELGNPLLGQSVTRQGHRTSERWLCDAGLGQCDEPHGNGEAKECHALARGGIARQSGDPIETTKEVLMPRIDLSAVEEATIATAPDGVAEGSRNDQLMRYACSLQARGVADEDIRDECLRTNDGFDPPLATWEVLAVVRSALRYPKGSAGATLGRSPSPRTVPEQPRVHRVGHPERIAQDWRAIQPATMLRAWVMACFEPADQICLTWDVQAGPSGELHAYAGQVADQFSGVAESVLAKAGDGGLWCVANPLDGSGRRRSANVARFANVLVECDELPAREQLERMCALLTDGRWVARAVTWSAGKSMHAMVRVRAEDAAGYAAEKDALYQWCRVNGLPVDQRCGNPSRLTRAPGARRGGAMQTPVWMLRPEACWDGTPSTWAVPMDKEA